MILRRGVRDRPDVSALASRDGGALYILVWHYHDEDVSGPAATVTLNVSGLPTNPSGAARVTHDRVDEEHSNAFTTWKRMGSPQNPSRRQYAELESSCQLEVLTDPAAVQEADGEAQVTFELPRAAVSLLTIQWIRPIE